jgi:hypothetical protein
MSRQLTEEESRILKLIQLHYGPQNSGEAISWMNDDATLWVTNTTGETVLMVHVTNLANWRRDGTIGTDEELQRDWLQIEGT